MDYNEDDDGADDEESGKGELFFIADSSSSDSEGEVILSNQSYNSSCKVAPKLSRESSLPLLLAFSIPTGRALQDSSPSPTSSLNLQEDNEEEDSDQHIEEWMILGGKEQVGDSSIQLNLSYWNSSEDDSGDEG